MSDLEEGEVLDSESDEELKLTKSDCAHLAPGRERQAVVPPNTPNIGAGPGNRLSGIELSRATSDLYRSNSYHGYQGSSSEDEDSSDSDEDNYECKRKKRSNKMQTTSETFVPGKFQNPLLDRGISKNSVGKEQMDTGVSSDLEKKRESNHSNGDNRSHESKRRVNNIWGSVLDEQMLTKNLGGFGVEKDDDLEKESDRNVEFYDYTKRDEDDRPYLEEPEEPVVSNDPFEAVIEDTNSNDMDVSNENKNHSSSANFRKRVHDRVGRKNAKERIGKRTYNKNRSRDHIEATAEDSVPKIVNCIVNQLNEPKVQLIARVVERLGKKRALELLYETEDIEVRGGMMTFNLQRRRTPGGVYIQLLKTDPDVTKDDLNEIFQDELQERKEFKKKMKKARRRAQNRKQDCDRLITDQAEEDPSENQCFTECPIEGSTDQSPGTDVNTKHKVEDNEVLSDNLSDLEEPELGADMELELM